MLRVLLIDDTRAVHAFVRNLLAKSSEIEVVGVFDGAEALKLLEQDRRFDLVLLDWEMPLKTGPETLEEFNLRGITIPTMMMTTKNRPEDIERVLALGVVEYLMKPFTADILFEKIEFATGRAVKYVA